VLAALALAVTLAGGCRRAGPGGPPPLETEQVGAAIDVAVTTDYDVQARSAQEIVGSKLPASFPADVPLDASSSLINHGPAAPGRDFIELSVPAEPSVVERRYDAQLEAAGWRRGAGGSFQRRGRTIVVSYRQGTPGTWVRIEYQV